MSSTPNRAGVHFPGADFFVSPVGRRCCAAQEFRAERQLCPTNKAKNFVVRPHFPLRSFSTCRAAGKAYDLRRHQKTNEGTKWGGKEKASGRKSKPSRIWVRPGLSKKRF